MQEMGSGFERIVDGLRVKERDRVRADQSLVKASWLCTLEEAGCLYPEHGLQVDLDQM